MSKPIRDTVYGLAWLTYLVAYWLKLHSLMLVSGGVVAVVGIANYITNRRDLYYAKPALRCWIPAIRRGVSVGESSFELVLESVSENSKPAAIQTLRGLYRMGEQDARDLIYNVPQVLKDGASWSEAEFVKSKLEAAGAKIDIRQIEDNS